MVAARIFLGCAVLVSTLAGRGLADPGDLDPTFNGGHLVLLDLSKTGDTGTGLAAAQIDGSGRVVVGGFALDDSGITAAALARLLPDGTLDQSFGDGGKRVIQAGQGGGTVFSMLQSLIPRAGGGWAATGGASASDGRQAALVLAVDDTGALDLNFGTGGSTRAQLAGAGPAYTLAFAGGGRGAADTGGNLFLAQPIALDPMDQTDVHLAVARFTPGGVLGGFATGGVYTNEFSQVAANTTYAIAALPTPDGILAVGSTLDATGRSAFLLVRLTLGGALDPTFGGGAGYRIQQVSDPSAGGPYSNATAVALGPGGVIYVGGTASDADSHGALAVARFTATGMLDTTFHGGGMARVQTGTADPGGTPASFLGDVAVQSDGSILLVGSSGSTTYTEMVVVRLTSNGDLDPSFGAGGIVRFQPSTVSEPETFGSGARIAPDGNTLIATGQMRQAAGGRGIVARIQLTVTTTTTTLPDTCSPPGSLAAALCALQQLAAAVDAGAPAGRLQDRLAASIAKCTARATASGDQTGRARKKSLKRALTALRRFQGQLRTKKAQAAIAADTRTALADQAAQIATILTTLRAGG